jgi:peroxiredoxin
MRYLALFVVILATTICHAKPVEDFMLLDQNGKAHRLHYYSDASAIVVMIQGNGCPIVRNLLPDFKQVRDEYESKGVVFLMLNSNLQDSRDSIRSEAEEWGIDFAILDDDTQLISEALGVTRTAEVLVLDPGNWNIVYRGAVNDRVTYERQRKVAEKHYLLDTLEAMLAGENYAVDAHGAMGCLINFPKRDQPGGRISYSETIAPILQENCVTCHRTDGIAPWAMDSYTMVKGFSPMIREVIRTRRMPPWHADPEVGEWRHDRSLSITERQQLVHWIEAGSPRDEGKDPLSEPLTPHREWPLGEPDLVIDVPAFKVPASGVVDYQFPVVDNPLDKDVWVRAVTIAPGQVSVVHHVLAGTSEPGEVAQNNNESVFSNYLGGYAPGNETTYMPEGTGVFVPQGTQFLLQMHYTPVGKALTDRTRLGLYFHDEKPANFLRHSVVLNPRIRIPAHASEHEESAYFEFDKEAILYSVLPHSHYRGKSSTFSLRYPDGSERLLLSTPNYDFNWQRGYEFVQPLAVPAGAKLIHKTVYDNTARNPSNPNPAREVPWGLQSWDEMLYGDFTFSWVEESSTQPIHDKARMDVAQWFGFMDKDMDSRLAWEELPPRMQKRMQKSFAYGDSDKDNALTIDEYIALQRAQTQRRNRQAAAGQ